MSARPPFNTIRVPRTGGSFVNGMQDALYEIASPLPRRLDEGARWYAVHTLPYGELRAQEQLENQGFRTFLPKRHKTVRHARKLRHVDAAFFPRYLFVGLDLDRDRWRSVNGTYGVASLVMQSGRPHPVPRGVVEALVASADARGILLFGERLKVGGTIRLLAGAFAEQLATLESMDDSGRIHVLLDILGRKVSISTDRQHVFPIA
ncbi:MAG TPA: transcriptional activator RfaH [Stellaceae bacterium]|nr:transcriptional activator RfaH [Stellaceae bacterium]